MQWEAGAFINNEANQLGHVNPVKNVILINQVTKPLAIQTSSKDLLTVK